MTIVKLRLQFVIVAGIKLLRTILVWVNVLFWDFYTFVCKQKLQLIIMHITIIKIFVINVFILFK